MREGETSEEWDYAYSRFADKHMMFDLRRGFLDGELMRLNHDDNIDETTVRCPINRVLDFCITRSQSVRHPIILAKMAI